MQVPGSVVAVAMERSPLLVTALLAVVKAGAALPAGGPGYPAERIGEMLADAAPPLVVADTALAGRLPDTGAIPVLAADDLATAESLTEFDDQDLSDQERAGGSYRRFRRT